MKILEIENRLKRNTSPLCPHPAILWCFQRFFLFCLSVSLKMLYNREMFPELPVCTFQLHFSASAYWFSYTRLQLIFLTPYPNGYYPTLCIFPHIFLCCFPMLLVFFFCFFLLSLDVTAQVNRNY